MKHKRSLEALIVGFVLAIAVSFFSTKIAGAVLAVSLIQMFLFYRCPHCGYGLYNVCGMMPSCCPNCGEELEFDLSDCEPCVGPAAAADFSSVCCSMCC